MCVGIGGFIGASLRYLICINTSRLIITKFPCGTLIVNVLGGILIGVIMELSINTDYISENMKIFLTTGVMGGLTTFSTFSLETVNIFNNGDYGLSFINIILNLSLSILGVILGKAICNFYI